MKKLKRNPKTGELEYVEDDQDMTEEEKKRKKVQDSFNSSTGRNTFSKLKRMITGE